MRGERDHQGRDLVHGRIAFGEKIGVGLMVLIVSAVLTAIMNQIRFARLVVA